MSTPVDVAILGAGPYGLSIASHLRARGIDFRIFGRPMESWRAHMPAGMQLKSEGFATNLSDPAASLSLKQFCAEREIAYADIGIAIPVESFHAYGLCFRQRFVPAVEERMALGLEQTAAGFRLSFDEGEALEARRVIVAVELVAFREMPQELASLPPELVSHSADHGDLEQFRGRDVTVIGAGSSAVELATLLHEGGADVRLLTRKAEIRFQPAPQERPLWRRALRPLSGIGHGWHSMAIAELPQLFRLLPDSMRGPGVQHYLAPAPAWFVRERFMGKVDHIAGHALRSARQQAGGVELTLGRGDGSEMKLSSSHVIAATGYRVDVDRLTFLDPQLKGGIRRQDGSPRLSAHFESSVPGLYFLGPLSAGSFGPAMRFVLGADFAARNLSRHLSGVLRATVPAHPAAAPQPMLAADN